MLCPILAVAQTNATAAQLQQNNRAITETPSTADNRLRTSELSNGEAEVSENPSANASVADPNNPNQSQIETERTNLRQRSTLPPAQPVTFDPPKRRKGTGFFIQGGISMSLHR